LDFGFWIVRNRSKIQSPKSKIVILFLALLVLIAATACGEQAATPTPTVPPVTATAPQATAGDVTATTVPSADSFQNPVFRNDFPDPQVLKEDDTYYAYATNASGRNVQAATSKDLVHWQLLTDAMPAIGSWAKLGGSYVWAPEVIKIGDHYVLYYTARDKEADRQCIGVATSDKSQGKFKDSNDHALVCQASEGGSIDPDPFRDGDKLYLYWKNDGNCCGQPTYLYVQELAPDGLSLVGEPKQLVRNDKLWEGAVVEAPTMWKQDGKYYLFYSGNNYAGVEYSVGYANCQSATGPCEDAPENPILKTSLEKPPVIGPGHQTVVLDKDGQTWMVYHAWEVSGAGTKTSRRFMWIDPLEWNDGKPVVHGPTTAPQPMP
jgi:beta-xylosidase